MKEYKIITLTPTTNTTVKSMEGYVKSCETTLNKLAREGWKLVCTESISQQTMSNLIVFLERESSGMESFENHEAHEVPEVMNSKVEAFIEHPSSGVLPKN